MSRKRIIAVISVLVVIFLFGSGIAIKNNVKMKVREIFKLNGELKSEGYYMAEFEFKMLGVAYYLDKGQYITAYSRLNQIHKQLTTREGLIKVPEFSDKKEKLKFYLNLQNPRTGAFMDDSYPLFTYIGTTLNVAAYVNRLAQEAGEPFQLKYPLKFLDEINTPEKLKTFLDDLSTVGWIGAKFRTPYVEAAELAESIYYPGDMARYNLYAFSPEWKQALLRWFYDNQDSKTGYWGARLRSSEELLESGDLVSTEKIIKLFVDNKGNNLHGEFPLRNKDEMFATTLQKLAEPIPADLDELHDWILRRDRGIRFLTRYLWSSASPDNKNSARKLMEDFVRIRFEKFYIEREGAFSLYPGAEHADLDGTGEGLGMFDNIGALSSEKQELLWGPPDKNITDLGIHEVSELKESDFTPIKNSQGINSIRLYRTDPGPGNYTSDVICVNYPKETPVLDVMDLVPKATRWVNTTSQNMGNWVTKEDILHTELAGINIQPVPVLKGNLPLNLANEELQKNRELTVIGFDMLQIPRYKMTLRME